MKIEFMKRIHGQNSGKASALACLLKNESSSLTSCTFVLVHCTHIVSSHHKKMFHTFGTKTLAAAGQVINDGGARSVNVLIAKNNMQSVGGLKTVEKRPKQ